MKWMNPIGLCATLIICTSLLAGCNDQQQSHTKQTAKDFIAHVKKSFTKKEAPQPTKKAAKEVHFTPKNKKDPFGQAIHNSQIQHENTLLKDTSLSDIKLVGLVHRNDKQWAIVAGKQGNLYALEKGYRVSKQHALVVHIDANKVILDTNTGTTPSQRTLTLQEPTHAK